MLSPAFYLLLPLLGVTFGYEPSPDADIGYDYIVQVEPEMLGQLQEGGADAIETNLPPEVNPIRRIRVVVGRNSLPKKLRAPSPRDTAVTRATFRQDVDAAASPDIELLAQTGPGFGRSATGFLGGRRNTSATPPATTVPPVGNTRGEISRQLDNGFQNAQEDLVRGRDAVRGALNDLGQGGQRALDNGRQLVGDLVAPPNTRSFERDSRPIDNLADRARNAELARNDLRNTTESFRDTAGRAGFGANQPAHNPDDGHALTTDPNNRASSPGHWSDRTARQPGDRYADRSVLTDTRQPVAPPLASADDLRNDNRGRVTNERLPSDWGATRTQPVSNDTRADTRSGSALRFPDEPRISQPAPERGPRDNAIVSPMVDPSNATAAGHGTLVPVQARNDFNHSHDGHAHNDRSHFDELDRGRSARDGSFGVPGIDNTRSLASNGDDAATVDPWLTNPGAVETSTVQAKAGLVTPTPEQNSSTSAWVLACAVAIGSVVVNLFQWLNIVDIRNKYRVALRRTSPGFARSAAA
ncbi:MAG: hypothetical protein ACR2NU_11540 [Aeoliella sp.]